MRPFPKKLPNSQQSGITLTELMIAAFITIGSLGIGGWAVATMITSSKTSGSQNERRVELNRSLDFMASEIRQSAQINSDAKPGEFSPSSSEVDTTTVKDVLRLRVEGLTKPVIYYVATTATSNTAWRGPQVIYRWGPSFTSTGAYGADKSTPSTWTHQPLVDAIDSSATTSVTCPTSWTASPASGATGFYACIDPNNRVAQIFNKGRITKVLGQTAPYLASSQAFARSTNTSTTLPFVINTDNTVTNLDVSNTSFQVLGSAIQCGPGATPMNTAFTVSYKPSGTGTKISLPTANVNPALALPTIPLNNQPAGTIFDFTGSVPTLNNLNNTCSGSIPNGTSGFNSVASPVQVKILKHGDPVPDVKGFDGSTSVKGFMSSYVDSSDKVKLPSPGTQYIILFELGATDPTSSAFDQQDLVILVTVS